MYSRKSGLIIGFHGCDPEVDHQERLEKKKVQIGYEKGIDYNDMSWETIR